jgi:hypothetical protein
VLAAAVRDLSDVDAARRLLDLNPYEESAYLLLLDAEAGRTTATALASVARRCRFAFAEGGARPSSVLEQRLESIPAVGSRLRFPAKPCTVS